MHRWRALQNPASIGFSELSPADPPVRRTNLKDAVPCVALGTTSSGAAAIAVFVHGIDLDLVPFAVDAASRCGVQQVVIVARAKDITPSMKKMAESASLSVAFEYLNI
jgi:Flp pilus assembly protein TadG